MNRTRFRKATMTSSSFRRGVLLGTAIVFLLGFTATRGGAQENPVLQPEDYYRLVQVGDVAVSPAGDLVAFTVTRTVEEENRRRREVWVRTLDGGEPSGEPFRLTAPTEDSHSPRWSPDGSLLSFVSARAGDPNPIWFVRIGGVGGEAFHIEGVEGPPVWSPDGEWIAYLKTPETPDGPRLRIAPDAITSTLDSARFRGRVVTHLPYTRKSGSPKAGEGGADFVPHPSVAPRHQLFVVPAEGGEPRQLTALDVEIADPSWGEDGEHVYFAAGRFLDRPFEPPSTSALWRVTREEGELQRITGTVGYQRAPTVSPGGQLAYLDAPDPGTHAELRVIDLDRNGLPDDQPATRTDGFEGDPEAPRWSRDGETLFFAARDGGARHLYRTVEGGPVEPVTAGPRRLESFSLSADGRVLAYVATEAAAPPEVYVSRGDGTVEDRATAFNDAWLEGRSLSRAEPLTWISSDSTEIEGWVIPPTSIRMDGGHPLVLALRDHRYGASGHDFRPLHQILAGAGFFVFYANPRGSTGYGEPFQGAVRERWGLGEKDDLVSGVEAALARYPQADRERVGVVGHGYGGFLASWLTATSDRFVASVTSAPAVNWESWFGTSSARSLLERELGTLPWRRRSVYRRLSPLSFVENVTAPTLVLLGEEDRSFPPSEAEQWHTALRKRGVPTELVRYPGASHDMPQGGEPWQVADRLERIRSWFSNWLVEQPLESRVSEAPR